MKKLKVFKVDEITWWCDYSKEEARNNYREFCVDQGLYSEDEIDEYMEIFAEELSEEKLKVNSFYDYTEDKEISFKEELKNRTSPGLFHIEGMI